MDNKKMFENIAKILHNNSGEEVKKRADLCEAIIDVCSEAELSHFDILGALETAKFKMNKTADEKIEAMRCSMLDIKDLPEDVASSLRDLMQSLEKK